MKHLLTGVAVVAALAFTAPVGAQQANPSGGNAMGMPGPNPGGPGLTPYSGSAPRTAAPAPSSAPPAAMAPSAAPPSSSYESSSATPPSYHRHARHGYHKTATYRRGGKKGYPLTGSTANQLNQEELARLQGGNYSNPPAPSYSGSPPPSYSGSQPPPSYSGSPPPSYSGSPPPSPGYAGSPSQPSTPMGTTGGGAPYRP